MNKENINEQMKKGFLKDSFRMTGTNYEEFKDAVNFMMQHTSFVPFKNQDINVLSLTKNRGSKTNMTFIAFNKEMCKSFITNNNLGYVNVPIDGMDIELLEEMENTTEAMINYHHAYYILSDNAFPTLSMRCGVSGDKTFNRANLIRNMHIADAWTTSSGNSEMVIRELNGMKKIFSCLGSRYTEVPMSILYRMVDRLAQGDIDVENALGEPDVKWWSIDHNYTDIYIEFPEMVEDIKNAYNLEKDLVPGLFLCTSDTGYSSVIIRGTLRSGASYVILDELSKRHSNRTKLDNMIEDADTEIFSQYRKLPEKLCELMGKDVCDYNVVDLSTERGVALNREALDSIIEKAIRKLFTGILPAKKQKELKECIDGLLNDHKKYNLYDLAIIFLELPDVISNLERNQMSNFRKACGKAPYVLDSKKEVPTPLSIV